MFLSNVHFFLLALALIYQGARHDCEYSKSVERTVRRSCKTVDKNAVPLQILPFLRSHDHSRHIFSFFQMIIAFLYGHSAQRAKFRRFGFMRFFQGFFALISNSRTRRHNRARNIDTHYGNASIPTYIKLSYNRQIEAHAKNRHHQLDTDVLPKCASGKMVMLW